MVSAGARAYNLGLGAEPPAGVQGQNPCPPEADEVFVFKTLIFNIYATVLHQMMQAIVWVAYGFTVRICSLAIAEQHLCIKRQVECYDTYCPSRRQHGAYKSLGPRPHRMSWRHSIYGYDTTAILWV